MQLMNKFIVGITGNIFEEYTFEQKEMIHHLLDTSIDDLTNIHVLSHLVNTGISKVVYDWAWERDIKCLGLFNKRAWEFPVRLVHKAKFIGKDFGDEIPTFAHLCDGLLTFGKTENADFVPQLSNLVKQKGGNVIHLGREIRNIQFLEHKPEA